MFDLLCQVCLVFVAIQNKAFAFPVALPHHGLYDEGDYGEEYAPAFDNYKPIPYDFQYAVSDPHTGDHKSQWETKDEAGVITGSYSLLESDGSTRIVDYVADKNGFRAVVKKIGKHGEVKSVERHGTSQSDELSPVPNPLQGHGGIVPEKSEGFAIQNDQLFQSYDGGVENYENLEPVQLSNFASYHTQNLHGPSVDQNLFTDQQQISIADDENFSHKQLQYGSVFPSISSGKMHEEILYQQGNHDEGHRGQEPQVLTIQSTNNDESRQLFLPNFHDFGTDFVFHHPHGESSQMFYSKTGNNHDDSSYTE